MLRGVVCLTLVAVLGAAPAVHADRTAVSTTPDVVYAGQTEQGLPAFIQVLPHSAGIKAAFTYSTFCSGNDGSILWTGVAKAAVKGGRFHYVRKEDAKGPRITLNGRVGPSGVSGNWQVHFSTRTRLGNVTDTCDSGAVNWTLPRDGAGGQLASAYPLILRLAKRTVETVAVVTPVKCKSGDAYLIPRFYDNFAVAKDGTFGRTFSDTGVPSKGITSKLDIDFHGRLRRGQLSGTWHMRVTFSDSSGKQTDTCDSGVLRWTATA